MLDKRIILNVAVGVIIIVAAQGIYRLLTSKRDAQGNIIEDNIPSAIDVVMGVS